MILLKEVADLFDVFVAEELPCSFWLFIMVGHKCSDIGVDLFSVSSSFSDGIEAGEIEL